MKITYTTKTTVFALATVSALALLFALISERHYGYAPCRLCLIQRWWHCGVVAAALAAIAWPRYRILLVLQMVFLMVCAGVSGFHVGVEHHLWEGTRACEPVTDAPATGDDLLQQILSTPTERCDEPRWFFLGLSMAVYDLILTVAMAGFAAFTLVRRK